jgi:hypothetical protein
MAICSGLFGAGFKPKCILTRKLRMKPHTELDVALIPYGSFLKWWIPKSPWVFGSKLVIHDLDDLIDLGVS